MGMEVVIFVAVALLLAFGVEYVTRGLEPTPRMIILVVVAIVLLAYLARLLGVW